MGKFAEALAADDKRAGSRCLVCTALVEFDEEDAAALQAALDQGGRGVSFAAIGRSLRAAGYKVGDNAASRHAAGNCACGPVR